MTHTDPSERYSFPYFSVILPDDWVWTWIEKLGALVIGEKLILSSSSCAYCIESPRCHGGAILACRRYDLLNRPPVAQDIVRIDQVAAIDAIRRRCRIFDDARLYVTFDQTRPRDIPVRLDKPCLVHEPPGCAPRLPIQGQIETLEEHNARIAGYDYVVFHRVFEGVVEAGRENGFRRVGHGFAQGLDEAVESVGVKSEGRSSSVDGILGIWHGGQLRAVVVVSIHGDDRRRLALPALIKELVDFFHDTLRQCRLSRSRNARNGNQSTVMFRPATVNAWEGISVQLVCGGERTRASYPRPWRPTC